MSMEDVELRKGLSAAVNKFAPFTSELDWRVACWAIQDGIEHKSFDRLMTISGVAEKLGLSYQNILLETKLEGWIRKEGLGLSLCAVLLI
ncbi:hypothetical protein EDD22DRAFT_950509 [Suillus occidentalis]|nr:hypothetical protein EDD22DRAFT_950509 [Suillus occidentalis]